jgi:23S rRNA (guanosine2251-2'-O)-methyltransferase
MAGTRLARTQAGELSFPKPQDIGFDASQPADFADPEIQLIREFVDYWCYGRLSHGNNIILVAILAGIHPIQEALRSGRPLDRVLVVKGAANPRLQEIIDLCRQKGIPLRFEPREQLDRTAATPAHQGIIAVAAAREYASLEDVIGTTSGIVVLDGVEDPHNLGAIIRTADAAGVGAVVLPERRAAGLTDVVAKASAGAVEYVTIARSGNISQALEKLKDAGFWIYGLDERGESLYGGVQFNAPTAFVLGGEGKGLHAHVKKHCDALVRIPMSGRISSLNVSVAAGVVLFEWRRTIAAGRE